MKNFPIPKKHSLAELYAEEIPQSGSDTQDIRKETMREVAEVLE